MKESQKTICIIAAVGAAALLVGAVAFSVGLSEILPQEGVIAAFLGKNALSFGMKCCLLAILGVIFLVPSIRAQFSSSYSTGSNYKDAHKRGRGGGI